CLHQAGDARALSSFPTRRSSDLPGFHGALWAEHLGELIDRQACDPVVLGVDDDRESIDRHAKFGHLDAVLSAGIDLFLFDWARRSEEHTSELQSRENLVCRLLLE